MNRAAEIIDESRYPFALILITFVVAASVTSAVASTVVTLLAQAYTTRCSLIMGRDSVITASD